MIYILSGTDIAKKRAYEKTLTGERERISLPLSAVSRESLEEYAMSSSLFGETPVVVISDLFSETDLFSDAKDLASLADSKTIFIFIEDAFLVSEEKKYKKYATTIRFDGKKEKSVSKIDSFAIANAFARRDKISAWVSLVESIDSGVSPESISGILFWKIKTMILSGTRVFSKEELLSHSRALVSLYHDSHKGERDFAVGLEQFILSSLSK